MLATNLAFREMATTISEKNWTFPLQSFRSMGRQKARFELIKQRFRHWGTEGASE